MIGRSLGSGLAVVLACLLTGCGDEAEPGASTSPAPSATSPSSVGGDPGVADGSCADVIPQTAATALGWSPSQPLKDNGRCVVQAAGGRITLGTRAINGSGPEAAKEAFDDTCLDTDERGPGLDFLPAGTETCGQVLGDSGTGVAEVVMITDDSGVVQIRIEAVEPVEAADVETALTELVAAANAAY